MLSEKSIVLGVTASIAAYKAADLASKLVQANAEVDVVMTKDAVQFVTPLTFRSLTHRSVVVDLFDLDSELSVEHVALAEKADVVVIAPATANTLAKLAHGLADDPLTCTVLATRAPVIVAPAMDGHMYEATATQQNLMTLKERGYIQVGPDAGHLASGLVGHGRLANNTDIIGAINVVLGQSGDLAGKKFVVTAGGTREAIDPVRVVTNRSSGKMGHAIAEAARDRGAQVVLVTAAAVTSEPNPGMETVNVESVAEMRTAVLEACQDADAVVMAAAVSDYRPVVAAKQKIKKAGDSGLTLELEKTGDFFLEIPKHVLRVGFAAETEELIKNARRKLDKKGLSLIVANDVTQPDAGFGSETNRVVLLDKDGGEEVLPLMQKYDVAHRILDRAVSLLRD
ncbi:bifunctional phosphopantothenoylcysteine decarboxylase/phosphopantothenate--cysteine ligase CoaBC [Dehalococcoidia bacterium]|nr:bifunctional phosphopantothenoylcysteine decarboxylase/phosphopantothenate--cysteine ligase CoaBC [Dehalococcoidia bacterium]